MGFNQRWFAFIDSNTTVAVVQATTKEMAKERSQLISHIVNVPETCRVKPVKRSTVRNAPIFFDEHFLAIEEVLAKA